MNETECTEDTTDVPDFEHEDTDEDYLPGDSSSDEESQPVETSADHSPPHAIYLVFWTALVNLLRVMCSCPNCGSRSLCWISKELGSLLKVIFTCVDCAHIETWSSQPNIGRMAAGNIRLSAAILFSGATVTKILRVLSHMGVAAINHRTYFVHQQKVLISAIKSIWKERQLWYFSTLQAEGEAVICGGDGRADSPGHCAKYGTYTIMELKRRAILDLQIVQSNEVGGSFHMEKEGLSRSLALIESFIPVDTLVTDRHVSIAKMMREEHPEIRHLYDIWHVGKSIKKKLCALSLQKDCQQLTPWIKSIINHIYWSAVSSPLDSGKLIVAKWQSLINHMQNQHSGFGGLFPNCAHGDLQGKEVQKAWLKPCTKVSTEVERIVLNARLCKDLEQLSPKYQTSDLEAFHSLVLHFAPKMFVYSHIGMECRTILAALHFNENAHRKQAETKAGEKRFHINYPKAKKGDFVVRKILEDATYGYVKELLIRVESLCEGIKEWDEEELSEFFNEQPKRQPLNTAFTKPDKDHAIKAHTSRFA